MAKPLVFGKEYEVSLVSLNGNGGPVYSQTKTKACPAHTDNWNSPNFYDPDKDCKSDVPVVGSALEMFCRQTMADLQAAKVWQQTLGLSPALIEVNPVLLSRICATNAAKTKRTCRETWSENIILLKNPGIDWKAVDLTDWSGPGEITGNLATIIGTGVTIVGTVTGKWYIVAVGTILLGLETTSNIFAYMEDADKKQYLRLYPVKAAAVKDAAGTSLDTAGITTFQGCLPEYDLSPQKDTIIVAKSYGIFTDERISTYHYCHSEDEQD